MSEEHEAVSVSPKFLDSVIFLIQELIGIASDRTDLQGWEKDAIQRSKATIAYLKVIMRGRDE